MGSGNKTIITTLCIFSVIMIVISPGLLIIGLPALLFIPKTILPEKYKAITLAAAILLVFVTTAKSKADYDETNQESYFTKNNISAALGSTVILQPGSTLKNKADKLGKWSMLIAQDKTYQTPTYILKDPNSDDYFTMQGELLNNDFLITKSKYSNIKLDVVLDNKQIKVTDYSTGDAGDSFLTYTSHSNLLKLVEYINKDYSYEAIKSAYTAEQGEENESSN